MFYQRHRWIVPLILCLLVVVGDQASKIWIVEHLGPEPLVNYKTIAGDWFRFVYSQNTGIAFNFFPNMSSVFIITSILISLFVLYGYWFHLPNQSLFVQSSIGLILGGAVGNTADRIRVGFVIDFIQVGWWPIFNIADSAITIGAVVIAAYLTIASSMEPAPPPPKDDKLLQELLTKNMNTQNEPHE